MINLKWFLIGGLVGLFILEFIKQSNKMAEIYSESLEELFEMLEKEED